MNIFEVGVGIGVVIKFILVYIGVQGFLLYIYIDILVYFFEEVILIFVFYVKCMIFKILDVVWDFILQGYILGLYDLIVVVFVFYVILRLG